MSIIENVTDPISRETVGFERPICGVCHLPIHRPEGHSACVRQTQQEEAMANLEWKHKQQLKIEQARLEVEKNRPKTPEELRNEKLEAEAAKAQEEMTWRYRRERLADIMAEAANLRKLLEEHDKS